MKYIYESRASTIIYNVLIARADIRPWLLPANICPIVPITFLKARVPFEFVDISADIFHIDLDQVEDRIRSHNHAGLLYAHPYGNELTPNDFFASLKNIDQDFFILDDRCLCAPQFEYSALADLTLFSTGYAKAADLGSGGYAQVQDHFEYQQIKLPFTRSAYSDLETAYKQAVEARETFTYRDSQWLDTFNPELNWDAYRAKIENELISSLTYRIKLNQVYQNLLPREIQFEPPYQTWRFNIRIKNKINMLRAIFDAGLFASSHYASLAGIMSNGSAPQAEKLADEVINLFNDRHFDVERAEKICEVILENYES